jgi:hypothetical protein
MIMKKGLGLLLICTAAILLAPAANANTLFDTSLVSPNASNSATPGVYFGSGNPNGGFTVDFENGIEIGMRAIGRQSPTVINTPTDVYGVAPGFQPGQAPLASWDFEFSIDLKPYMAVGSNSGLDLNQITALLTVTDIYSGTSFSFDPLTALPDDAGYGPSGVTTGKTVPQHLNEATEWGAQNAENPAFFPGYNVFAQSSYRFDLTISQGSTLLASDEIMVNVGVPEPGTMMLLGSSLLGLGRLLRRRAAK